MEKLEEKAEKEKRRREERERKRAEKERKEEQVRRKRRRNLISRGIEGDSPEERSRLMLRLAERVLEKKVKVRGVEERIGERGREILLVIKKKAGERRR